MVIKKFTSSVTVLVTTTASTTAVVFHLLLNLHREQVLADRSDRPKGKKKLFEETTLTHLVVYEFTLKRESKL